MGGGGGWACSHRIVLILLRRNDKLFAVDTYYTCNYGICTMYPPSRGGSIVETLVPFCLVLVSFFFLLQEIIIAKNEDNG